MIGNVNWLVLVMQVLCIIGGLVIMYEGAMPAGLIIVMLGFGGLWTIVKEMLNER